MEPDKRGFDLPGNISMSMLALQHTLLGGMALGGAFATCIATPFMALGLSPKQLAARLPATFALSAMAGIAINGRMCPASGTRLLHE